MIGLVWAIFPALVVKVATGVVVPAAYVYIFPPDNTVPSLLKNCAAAPPREDKLTAIFLLQ
jgi:hypothetical protein